MVIDGKQLSQNILNDLQQRIAKLDFTPLLCDILVGDDAVSLSYVNIKAKTAEKIGLSFEVAQLQQTATTKGVINNIKELQSKSELCGLIVQLPLPEHIDARQVLDAIRPEVDVDCLSTKNNTAFYEGRAPLVPPTAGAIKYILDSLPFDLADKRILVIGQGELVGKPITYLLRSRDYQVTTADHSTANLASITPHADVIISGTGQPKLLYGSMIKPGAVIIDAGTAESGGGIVGDVDFESVKPVAGFISPVPGGVGPVTVAQLLANVVEVAESRS